MRLRFITIMMAVFCATGARAADILAKYTATSAGSTPPVNSGQVSYSTPSTLSYGAGAQGASASACGSDNNWSVTTAGIVTTEAAAVTANDYVTFTVTLTGPGAKFKTTSSPTFTAVLTSSNAGSGNARAYYAYGSAGFVAMGSGAISINKGSCGITGTTLSATVPAPVSTSETVLKIRLYLWNATSSATSAYTRVRSLQLTSPVVLPVTWTYAEAMAQNMGNLIKWGTASEYDNERFDIEYSHTGEEFRLLASVPGSGNSVTSRDYIYTDQAPVASRVYYRIRQVDFSGKSSYSPIFSTDNHWTTDLVAYPVPVTDMLHVILPEMPQVSPVTYRVANMQGTVIANGFTEPSQHLTIPAGMLPAGMYILELNSGQRVRFSK